MVDVSSKEETTRSATAVGLVRFGSPAVLPLVESASLKKGDVLTVARVAGIMAAKQTANIVPLCHSGVGIEGVQCHLRLVHGTERVLQEEQAERTTLGEMKSNNGARESKEDVEEQGVGTETAMRQKKHHGLSQAARGGMDACGQTVDPNIDPRLDEYLSKSIGLYGGIRIAATLTCSGKTGVEMEALCAVAGAGLTILDMVKSVDRGADLDAIRNVLKTGGRSGTWIAPGWGYEE
jgi:molybdenum cofactor biosynthesis protein MoaC